MSTTGPRRRALIAAIPVAAGLAACTSAPKREPARDAPVLHRPPGRRGRGRDRADRPRPADDPAEAGHPGAREAGVTGYIDAMLGRPADGPGKVFAGGPWSNRHTSGPDLMARFAPLDPVAKIAWRNRLTAWQDQYAQGIEHLDKLAGGDFTKASQRNRTRSSPPSR